MTTTYVYVTGAESGVGKSTVCLSLLAQLLSAGYAPGQLAYIKPVTQCTQTQPVAEFCRQTGIVCEDLGCLVFYQNFSRDFIDGLTASSVELLAQVIASIRAIGQDKSVVIIDGMGDPAAGSVVGVANVDVALAVAAKVIFVGKPGIGAAIDNTVLCATFMQCKGLHTIGVIYNAIPIEIVADMKNYVSKRLSVFLPTITLLGFVAKCPEYNVKNLPQWFDSFVDKQLLLRDWLGLGGD
ncbi:MAG: AAA family ATPase [Methylococcales bacterium]